MKLQCLIFSISLLFAVGNLIGQTNRSERLIFPFLSIENQSNVTVSADMNHPRPCPLELTNLISNTNLFSLAEQKKLREITLKYQNVTTNSGPAGTVFKGWGLRQVKIETWTNTFYVACFAYTNSDAQEEIAEKYSEHITIRFRSQSGNGYDMGFINGLIFAYQEYKDGVLDGLFVALYDPNNPSDQEHCGMWARFVKGKVSGKFIIWRPDGKIQDMAEFMQPFDLIKLATTKLDLAWTEVPIKITNSVLNPK